MKNRSVTGRIVMLAAMGVARAEDLDLIAVRQARHAMQGGDFAHNRPVLAV